MPDREKNIHFSVKRFCRNLSQIPFSQSCVCVLSVPAVPSGLVTDSSDAWSHAGPGHPDRCCQQPAFDSGTVPLLRLAHSCCQKVKMPSDVASGNQSAWEGYRQFAQVIIGCKSANCVCTVEQQSQSTKSLGHMHHQSPHLSHTLAMITMHKHTLDGSDPGHRAGRSCCERPVLSQTLLAHIFIP